MQYPEDFPDIQGILFLRTDTDTATPRAQVPVLYIHSQEKPFCRDFACECHLYQRHVASLLGAVYEGEMTLREAAYFADSWGQS